MKKVIRKCIVLLIIFLFAAKAFPETITAPSVIPGDVYGNTLVLGVTDDANKNRMMLRTDVNGYLKITLGTALSYSIDSITTYPPDPSYNYYAPAVTTSYQIKSAGGYLFSIIIGDEGDSGSTVTIYDNTSCATTIVGVLDTQAVRGSVAYNLKFGTGLCITISGTTAWPKVTVVWK